MDSASSQHRVRTLGEWLTGLRPGDACPCCGARLVVAPRAGVARKAVAFGAVAAPTGPVAPAAGGHANVCALVCPACCCELDEEDAPSAAGTCRALCTAA